MKYKYIITGVKILACYLVSRMVALHGRMVAGQSTKDCHKKVSEQASGRGH